MCEQGRSGVRVSVRVSLWRVCPVPIGTASAGRQVLEYVRVFTLRNGL
jgi:hypothetical protein